MFYIITEREASITGDRSSTLRYIVLYLHLPATGSSSSAYYFIMIFEFYTRPTAILTLLCSPPNQSLVGSGRLPSRERLDSPLAL